MKVWNLLQWHWDWNTNKSSLNWGQTLKNVQSPFMVPALFFCRVWKEHLLKQMEQFMVPEIQGSEFLFVYKVLGFKSKASMNPVGIFHGRLWGTDRNLDAKFSVSVTLLSSLSLCACISFRFGLFFYLSEPTTLLFTHTHTPIVNNFSMTLHLALSSSPPSVRMSIFR